MTIGDRWEGGEMNENSGDVGLGKKRTALIDIWVLVLPLLAADAALATDLPVIDMKPGDASVLDLFVGGNVDYSPDYEGSDDYDLDYYPEFTLSWRERIEVGYSDGVDARIFFPDIGFYGLDEIEIGYYDGDFDARVTIPDIGLFWLDEIDLAYNDRSEVIFVDRNDYELGIALDEQFGRSDDDNDVLEGLDEIDESFTGSVFGEIPLGELALGAEFIHDLGGGHEGYTIDLTLEAYWDFLDGDLEIDLGPTVTWASQNYMDAFFGISDDEAAESGLDSNDAEAGFKSVGVYFELLYDITDQWTLEFEAGYDRLLGDAARSDIVAVEGDPNQVEAAVFLERSFSLWR